MTFRQMAYQRCSLKLLQEITPGNAGVDPRSQAPAAEMIRGQRNPNVHLVSTSDSNPKRHRASSITSLSLHFITAKSYVDFAM